ncbi:MAG TPA: DUF4129 domain-containing protein [Microbacterium sp.]|nr:DUF4129 domain-containing protein [Microbacterium sp.]
MITLTAADLPIVPDPGQAQRWAEQELSRTEYAITEPTLFDRIAQAIGDFFADLLSSRPPAGWDGLLALVLIVVAVLLVAAAFLIWGRPRSIHRSRAADAGLFAADERSADGLRADAAARAAAQDWAGAVVLRFRALARGLAERGVVDPVPGATVHAFARQATRAFPTESERLEAAAAAFDDVRYLRRPGTPQLYGLIAGVDDALAALRPLQLADIPELV